MSFFVRFINWVKSKFSVPNSVEKSAQLPTPGSRGSFEWYAFNYDHAHINPKYLNEAKKAADLVLKNKERYKLVADQFGLPWWVIGCIHWREASCDFSGVLHNGEKIIGKGTKTKKVPAGRGPFLTWEQAAIDAIKFDNIDKKCLKYGLILEGILKALEEYNGMGYFYHHPEQLTCYLYSYTNLIKPQGRYTYDNFYNPFADANDYCGIVPIIQILALKNEIQLVRYSPKKEEIKPITQSETPWLKWFNDRLGWTEFDHDKELSELWALSKNCKNYKTVIGKEHAWCGISAAGSLKFAGYAYPEDCESAFSYLKYGISVDYKKIGIPKGSALVFAHSHVCFANRDHLPSETLIDCIGGNMDNMIKIKTYDITKDPLAAVRQPVKVK